MLKLNLMMKKKLISLTNLINQKKNLLPEAWKALKKTLIWSQLKPKNPSSHQPKKLVQQTSNK